MKLHERSLAEVCRERWERGKEQYGSEYFVGDPIEHAMEEIADAVNYVNQAYATAERLGERRADFVALLRALCGLWEGLRDLARCAQEGSIVVPGSTPGTPRPRRAGSG